MSTNGRAVQSTLHDSDLCIAHANLPISGSSERSRFKRNNSDFFIVSSEKSKDTTSNLSAEQRRERFSSRRPKSFKELLFSRKQDKRQAKEETKSKFANIVSKHLLPLKLVTSIKGKEHRPSELPGPCCNSNIPAIQNSDSPISSVDDIPEKTQVYAIKPELRSSPVKQKSSPSQQYRHSLTNNTNPLRVQHLALPNSPSDRHFAAVDIFTTSFTRSHSPNSVQSLKREGVCKSAQELPLKSPLIASKQKLTRSYSDTPPRLTVKQSSTSSLTIATCLQSKMYKNEHVSQILDYLFIGSIETAYNEPQLCRLKIDSLVDMSNMAASQVPSSKKLHCPCMCPDADRHFRSRLIIRIDDDKDEDIEQYFSEINKFIDGARRCGKKVLIFSYHGKSRAPAAAIQYMMKYENFLLRQAYNLLKNQRPVIDVNPGFTETLERVERSLFPEAKPSVSFSNDYLNIADPQAIKCAWVDCTDM